MTSALDFKQLYIFYKFYLIKRIYLSERITYLEQRLTVELKNSYTLASVSVLCFTENECLKFS